jgi:flavin reductase (DIM6/NTAB) family NADH-FMN oxidoreductase RutF
MGGGSAVFSGYTRAPSLQPLLQGLQFLARLETHRLARRNGYLGASAGIAADPGLSRLYVEHSEATQFDAITLLERTFHAIENRFHRGFRLGLGNTGPVHHFVDDIEFDQGASDVFLQPDDRIDFTPMSSNSATVPRKGVSPEAFLRACAQFATGVAIATVLDGSGAPHGMTVNSFTSVSLIPPLVLVCIDHKAGIRNLLLKSNLFAVNVLRESQQELSMQFARPGEDRFGAVEWFPGETGVPLIPGALATLECAVFERIESGDHTIMIGEVVSAIRHEGRPLLYFSSSYQNLAEPLTEPGEN